MFDIRYKLMTLVNDDLKAYGTANEFVEDDQRKLDVFIRQYQLALPHNHNNFPQAATVARDNSIQIWIALNPPKPDA